MNLNALAERLTAAGLGRVGEGIFFHNMPDVSEGILFRLPLEGVSIDHELPGYYRHKLQVVLRALKVADAEARARQVVEALWIKREETVGTMSVTYIRPCSLPIIYPRSEQSQAAEASINFDCCYVIV